MESRIGKKQTSKHEDWLWTIEHIEEFRTKAEIEKLLHDTAEEVEKNLRGKTVCYAHSGGKDSIVLEEVCELIGIKNCIHGRTQELDYPKFRDWFDENKPEQCEIYEVPLTFEWLSNEPSMLWPRDYTHIYRWMQIIHQKGIEEYLKKYKYEAILLGRRTQDGNFVGKKTNIYEARGVIRYSPISDWNHEDVLALLHYHNRELPSCYSEQDGYITGTGVWPEKPFKNSDHFMWDRTYRDDASIVEKAAKYFPEARKYLLNK